MSIAVARAAARKLSKDSNATLPIDVSDLVHWRGLALEYDDAWASELCARYYPADKVIVVNARHGRERQRFSISHELGHFILGHEAVELDHYLSSIFGDADESFKVEGDLEQEANAFAAELLMPRQWVKGVAGSHGAKELVSLIATECEVSTQAAWYRIIELRVGEFQKTRRRRL
jgi:Zn-dependent peptidase ImmA (M78 family)